MPKSTLTFAIQVIHAMSPSEHKCTQSSCRPIHYTADMRILHLPITSIFVVHRECTFDAMKKCRLIFLPANWTNICRVWKCNCSHLDNLRCVVFMLINKVNGGWIFSLYYLYYCMNISKVQLVCKFLAFWHLGIFFSWDDCNNSLWTCHNSKTFTENELLDKF